MDAIKSKIPLVIRTYEFVYHDADSNEEQKIKVKGRCFQSAVQIFHWKTAENGMLKVIVSCEEIGETHY